MEKDKHLGLRIDSDTHKKLKNLAEYDGRSINGEELYLIRQAIAEHEKKHGSLDDNLILELSLPVLKNRYGKFLFNSYIYLLANCPYFFQTMYP